MNEPSKQSVECIELLDKANIKLTYRSRLITLAVLCNLLLLGILLKFFDFQWLQYDRYKLQSNDNRFQLTTLPPVRGQIYDRKGRRLASTEIIYNLEFTLKSKENIPEQIQLINKLLDSNIQLKDLIEKNRNNAPVLLKNNLTEKALARLSAHLNYLPNVRITTNLQRTYPYQSSAAHLIGYTDTIKKTDLQRENADQLIQYKRIGRTGIESFYDEHLRGENGFATLEQNVYGKTVRTIQKTSPINGKDIHLSIDIEFQQYIESLMRPYQGAVAVQHVKTGEMLALVSMPNFDLNIADHDKQSENYKKILKHPGKPFLNRAIKGLYPPASTLKPFIALAALEDSSWEPFKKIHAGNYYQLPNAKEQRFFHDWKKGGHGWINLPQAIARSSDVYFYNLGFNVGIDILSNFLTKFYWGNITAIDLHGESKGLLPSRAWKARNKFEAWFPGETVVFSIGQGYALATPLQLAANTSILANKGKILPPRLTLTNSAPVNTRLNETELKQIPIKKISNWEIIEDAMQRTIQSHLGTANGIANTLSVPLAGKTGTAQVVALSQDPETREHQKKNLKKEQQDHALFIGYTPIKSPEISLSIVVEHTGSGGSLAAPLASKIANKYFELYPHKS